MLKGSVDEVEIRVVLVVLEDWALITQLRMESVQRYGSFIVDEFDEN